MTGLLDGELADGIGNALLDADLALDITLARTTPGGGPSYDPDPSTVTTYPAKGFTDTFSESYLAGGLVEAGDVKIVIIATTLAIEPAPGDRATIKGETYTVVSVSADPARALFDLQGRR
ncbi:MAG: hypothetical protein K2Y27_00860 [Xanthobacteraceae bacterium]|nr:hypothetical protein [Xanthobacteraceae bacterium]